MNGAGRSIASGARIRGGGDIFTLIVAKHPEKSWKPAPRVDLAEFAMQSNMRG